MAEGDRQVDFPLYEFKGPLLPHFERESYRLTAAQRIEIITLRRTGFSKNAISQRLGIHHSSVDRWIGRYEETGGLEVIKLPGPRNLTTEEEDFNLACCGIFLIFNLKFGHIFTYFLLFS
jgi:hypothetical protein